MTNPVAPVEGHYAILRNGSVIGPMRKEYEYSDIFVIDLVDELDWESNGDFRSGALIYHHNLDIIATISPADMQAVASGELERLRAANEKMKATMQEVRLIAVDAQLRATYQRTALESISAKLRTALEGGTV